MGRGEKLFSFAQVMVFVQRVIQRVASALIKTQNEKPIHKLAANNDSRQHELIEICSIVQTTIVEKKHVELCTYHHTQCVWNFMHKSKSLPQPLNFCESRKKIRATTNNGKIANDTFDATWSEYIKMCAIIRNKLELWKESEEAKKRWNKYATRTLKQVDYCEALMKHFQKKKKKKSG